MLSSEMGVVALDHCLIHLKRNLGVGESLGILLLKLVDLIFLRESGDVVVRALRFCLVHHLLINLLLASGLCNIFMIPDLCLSSITLV